MKRCPQCNRTYTDEALSFCLDDGSPLVSMAAPSSFDPSATVQYPQGRDTSPPPTIAYPGQSAPPPPQPPPAYSPMPPPQPRKRSVWPWLLGIGAVLVFIGIGLVILIFAIARITNDNGNHVANNNNNANRNANVNRNANGNRNTNVNSNSNSNSNANTRSSLTSFTDDFSTKNWPEGTSPYGTIAYSNGEYHMASASGKYLVRYAPDRSEYQSENATVRVGTRSIDGDVAATGYGLLVHGYTTKEGQFEDYGFLISNGDSPKYRIILHRGGKESTIVQPTTSTTIRTGTTPNQLEVRIRDLKMDFYINGQFVTSIVDEAGFRKGLVGFYTSGPGEVAFDDLEINR
jgi:hypothetical protein